MSALIAWSSLIIHLGFLRASISGKERTRFLSCIEVLTFQAQKNPISAFAKSYKRKECQKKNVIFPV